MAILVTGGAGFIGSHTCVELLQKGYEVVIADSFSNSSRDVPERIARIAGKQPKVCALDVADCQALERVFVDNPIDAVIHFAGFKAVGESCKIPLRYYRNNLDTTLTLLETMERHGCRKLVFSSSATVYGPKHPCPYVEEMDTSATNPYGWTKVMIEQILRDFCTANPSFSAVLLRYFNPIGAHESGLLGDDPNGIPNNLMPYIARVAAGQLPKLTVFGDDYPTRDAGVCPDAHRRGGLQPRHRGRRFRAGAGAHLPAGQRDSRSLRHRPAARRGSGGGLRQPRQSPS